MPANSIISEDFIEKRVIFLARNVLRFIKDDLMELHANELLSIIISDSIQAITFVSLIEDEFEIEIEDDYISYEFFSDIKTIVKAVRYSL